MTKLDGSTPTGFSDTKGEPNYWLDAVRDFWAQTGLDTDETELRWIVNWFDNKRREKSDESNKTN